MLELRNALLNAKLNSVEIPRQENNKTKAMIRISATELFHTVFHRIY